MDPVPELSTISADKEVFAEIDAAESVPRELLRSSAASGVEEKPIPSLFSPFGESIIFPVVLPPKIKELFCKLCMVELFASSTSPLPVEPESVAIGASLLVPIIANCADVVELPPTAKSKVELLR